MHILAETFCFRCENYLLNPIDADANIFWEDIVNTMAADALATNIARPSAAMILTT